jgi:hypothetical protein
MNTFSGFAAFLCLHGDEMGNMTPPSLAFWGMGIVPLLELKGKKQEEAETTKKSKRYQNKHKKSWPLLFIAPALPHEYSAVLELKSVKV